MLRLDLVRFGRLLGLLFSLEVLGTAGGYICSWKSIWIWFARGSLSECRVICWSTEERPKAAVQLLKKFEH